MCPGGQDEGLDLILPFLQKVAAKGNSGSSCVAKFGEAADFCQKKHEKGEHVPGDVQDKVVQDIDRTEGTRIRSNMQAVELHVTVPALNVSHNLRIASATVPSEAAHSSGLQPSFDQSKINLDQRSSFLEDLRVAVYTACLISYVQGINIICVADDKNKRYISYPSIPHIWRAGCIVQSDRITDLLEEIFLKSVEKNNYNLLYEPKIASELKQGFDALKKVVLKGTECNAVIPSLSASLEYLKYVGNLDLPTQFYEAELDYFGKHMYHSKSEDPDPAEPVSGQRDFEREKV